MTESQQKIAPEKHEEILCAAERAAQSGRNWVAFYRDVLGLTGLIRREFHNPVLLAEFERSETYRRIQQLLARLRERSADTTNASDATNATNTPEPTEGEEKSPPEKEEATRVITVRLPKCLHEALRAEAHDHRTSMNKLCISKLLQFIDHEFVPAD